MAICCVSEKSRTTYVCESTLRVLAFSASLHLTIFERPANLWFSTTSIKNTRSP